LLDGAFVINEDPDSGQTVADKNVMIVKGSIYGVLFDELELSKKIASTEIAQFDGADITIPELNSFVVDLKNRDTINDTTTSVTLTITGNGHVAWNVSKSKIVNDLAGTKKKDVTTNLSKLPSIEKASVKVSPFWMMKLPTNTESITVNVIDPK
jgi:hypothetical protein